MRDCRTCGQPEASKGSCSHCSSVEQPLSWYVTLGSRLEPHEREQSNNGGPKKLFLGIF